MLLLSNQPMQTASGFVAVASAAILSLKTI